MINIIPKVIALFGHVNFIIGGDGPLMAELNAMIEKYNLHNRIELLGAQSHNQVPDVLRRGHIFLNTSLTESFCIAILEAACCGLLVVSTDVGGVPEVLPPHMAYLAKPDDQEIFKQVCRAIINIGEVDTSTFYDECTKLYSWRTVAERTEAVYNHVTEMPIKNSLGRIKASTAWGSPLLVIWSIAYVIIESIVSFLIQHLLPDNLIDISRNFDSQKYSLEPT